MISVVDYRAGNAPSVLFALEHLGLPARLVDTADEVAHADRIILPGVGAARATIDSLVEQDLVGALSDRVQGDGVPFLGICIGLQVLFDHSEEGDTDCLGWVPGQVRRFPDTGRVPQIGWNRVRFTREHPLTADAPADGHFYFVNSYYGAPADPADALGLTDYTVEFCSVVARANVVATQFHAEKSGPLGLSLLRAFAAWEPAASEPAC
ncbi:MAG TPA: imidazole glycerol phosphate synthase subunit HisH [Acidimicrobiia bacterium]